ncbi:MAG: hypothetical protein ACAH22_15880, partial [Tardiphaga sp.]
KHLSPQISTPAWSHHGSRLHATTGRDQAIADVGDNAGMLLPSACAVAVLNLPAQTWLMKR